MLVFYAFIYYNDDNIPLHTRTHTQQVVRAAVRRQLRVIWTISEMTMKWTITT